jgi:hypothetical protein
MESSENIEGAAQALLAGKLAEQEALRAQIASRQSTRKWMPLGGLIGLAVGWAVAELSHLPTFPPVIFALATGAVLGAFLDRRRRQP